MTNDHHDTVVVERGGSGMGAILGILAILVLLAAVWYFALGHGSSPSGTGGKTNNGGANSTQQAPAATDAPTGS